MIGKRKGQPVLMCDKCGGLISWEIDPEKDHYHVCTKCIDKNYGRYRILTLDKHDLKFFKVTPESVSDRELEHCAEWVTDQVMTGTYFFDAVRKYVETHNIGNQRNG